MSAPVGSSRNLAGFVIVAAWVVTLAVNAPGHLSFDSVVQFLEGRTGVYGSMHPPVMSALIGLADRVVAGTALYLASVTAIFFGALLVASRRPSGSALGRILPLLLLTAVLISPPLLIYQGIVWKDVLFANLAVAAFAAAGVALDRQAASLRSAGAWIVAVGLAGLAATVRQNGLLVPIGIALVFAAAPSAASGLLRRAGVAAFAFAAALGTMVALQAAVRATAVEPPGEITRLGLRALQAYDIQGMAARGAAISSAAPLGAGAADEIAGYAVRNYRASRLDPPNVEPPPEALHRLTPDEVQRIWWAMLVAEPAAYLAHRAAVLRWHLWPPDIMQCLPIHVGVGGPAEAMALLRLSPGTRPGDEKLYRLALPLFDTPLFRHAAWILASLAIVAVIGLRRVSEPADLAVLALQATALAFAASYAVIGIACDFRYIFFLPAAVCLGLAHLARGRYWMKPS
jgi:hypothetical protein